SAEELNLLVGKGRSRRGILEGDLEAGELEIGQIVANISKIESAEAIVEDMMREFRESVDKGVERFEG
ncbi:MAG: hypothetical protein V4616_13810, partial [Bacteroidota bacterium]